MCLPLPIWKLKSEESFNMIQNWFRTSACHEYVYIATHWKFCIELLWLQKFQLASESISKLKSYVNLIHVDHMKSWSFFIQDLIKYQFSKSAN